jgi:hypothetical protein
MIAKELARALRAHTGRTYVEVSNGVDFHIVQAVKADLVHFADNNFHPDDETGYTLNAHSGIFGRDYSA